MGSRHYTADETCSRSKAGTPSIVHQLVVRQLSFKPCDDIGVVLNSALLTMDDLQAVCRGLLSWYASARRCLQRVWGLVRGCSQSRGIGDACRSCAKAASLRVVLFIIEMKRTKCSKSALISRVTLPVPEPGVTIKRPSRCAWHSSHEALLSLRQRSCPTSHPHGNGGAIDTHCRWHGFSPREWHLDTTVPDSRRARSP